MIAVHELVKRYGRATVVDHLSFEVLPGRVTGFVGPNGAGKSTTIRMILGLDTPTGGRALIGDSAYRSLARPLETAGALLDAAAIHGGRNARAHLMWMAAAGRLPRRRVDDVLEQTGLTAVAHKRVRTFSLGMRQRLGVAAALLGDPPCLLFDEPVNGLDPEGVRWIRTLMRDQAAQGRTVLVSSHLMSEMALTADHLIVIGRGRLIADLPARDLVTADVLVRADRAEELAGLLRAGGATVRPEPGGGLAVTGATPEEIGRTAGAAGIAVYELSRRETSLEDAYLDVTDAAVEYRAER
ncbi:ATP-binding cassette domain-containing protein [Actinomadura macra]|uniref:ATP-binding cassette domain-containing protein n=1 Tax=Actinomadura macra TaxID=46164 RepID=UPI000830CDB8|nr:ATP-binding cassette domain-containing protein [Actinomadura macra]